MIGWALETLLSVTLLMLLVLALRRPVARFVGAPFAYALWLVPALRTIVPPLPEFGAPASVLPLAVLPAVGEAAASSSLSSEPGQWVPVLLALWAGGAAVFAAWHWLIYRRFLHGLSRTLRPGDPASFGGVPVFASAAAEGPLAVGILDRRIVVPLDFALRYGPQERTLALAHELTHHRRGDLCWNLLALLILALNWFNPIAWAAFRAFRTDQELACDAAVTSAAPELKHLYATALVKSASRTGLIAACPLNPADQLKRRLKMIKMHRSSKFRTFAGASLVATLTASGLVLSAPGFAQEKAVEEKAIRDVIIKRITADGRPLRLEGKDAAELLTRCQGQKAESDVEAGEGKEKLRTRIVICSNDKNANSPERNAKLAEALERARGELGRQEEMSPERRAEFQAAIDREIARLRSQPKQ